MSEHETEITTIEEAVAREAVAQGGMCGYVFVAAINGIGQEIVAINAANGWNVTTPQSWNSHDSYKVPAVIALIHSELSEALEGFRHDDRANFAEECADAFIRLIDMTHGLGIDLGAEVLAKLEKNKGRGFRHGGKRV